MDAAPVLSFARRWWWLIVLGAIMAVAAFGVASRIRDRADDAPMYRARATLVVSAGDSLQTTTDAVVDRPWDLDRLMATYAEIITSDVVAARAARELGDRARADDIQRRISVDTPGYTQLLRVSARAASPEDAERLAGAIVWSATAIREEKQLPGSLALFDQTPAALVPDDATPLGLAVLIVALAGAAGAAALVVAFEYLTGVIRDARAVSDTTGLAVLAVVPEVQTARVVMNGASPYEQRAAERFRMLRTAFGLATSEIPVGAVLVTSPRRGVETSYVASNFALAAAQAGRRVALVDADLRSPSVHEALGVSSDPGLAEALIGSLALDTASLPSAPGVAFIAAGTPPLNPSELLDSPDFRALVAELRERFDLLVFAAPPALDVTDASVVASHCDAVLVVACAGRTTRRDVSSCVDLLRNAETSRPAAGVAGVVLTENRGWVGASLSAWFRSVGRHAEVAAS
jgi:capsular exopolysaccharide synthesis family protein